MSIKIPRSIVKLSSTFYQWGNVSVYRHPRFELVRLDILIAIGCVLATAQGYWYDGAWGALGAFLVYIMFCMIGLWM